MHHLWQLVSLSRRWVTIVSLFRAFPRREASASIYGAEDAANTVRLLFFVCTRSVLSRSDLHEDPHEALPGPRVRCGGCRSGEVIWWDWNGPSDAQADPVEVGGGGQTPNGYKERSRPVSATYYESINIVFHCLLPVHGSSDNGYV